MKIDLAKKAAAGASLLLIAACGGGGGDAATYVKLCSKEPGATRDGCQCVAKYLQANVTKKHFRHYVKTAVEVAKEYGGFAEGGMKLASLAESDPAFAHVMGKELEAIFTGVCTPR